MVHMLGELGCDSALTTIYLTQTERMEDGPYFPFN